MSGSHSRKEPHLTCDECRLGLQDYLDGTLERARSMRLFLHLRECPDCEAELEQWQHLVESLESMPARTPPTDLDDRILAAVPYDQYRAMAGLRAPRVPVFLEHEALPAWLRARATQFGGAVVAAAAIGLRAADLAGEPAVAVAVVGLIPAAAVILQAAARRVVLAGRQARQEG
jgi:anti-sigma factor RsiW